MLAREPTERSRPPGKEGLAPMEIFGDIVLAVEVVGVLAIVVGLLYAFGRFAWPRRVDGSRFRQLRQDVGRGILLGLEILIAADIIRTVAVDPTLDSVIVLGVIVLIRTFLSMTLEMELEGRWPWQRARGSAGRDSGPG